MIIKQLEVTIGGDVQGVAFRYNVRDWAQGLGIVGYVQNRSDGTVYVIAQGTQENLDKLLKKCYAGPRHAKVKDIKPHWSKVTTEFLLFEIKI